MIVIQAKEKRVVALAATSRVLCICMIILADWAFEDLATSAHLSNFECLSSSASAQPLNLNPSPSTPLDHLAPWDSMYFVRISKCGYENDMIHAFFPLLPMLIRAMDILTGSRWLLARHLPPESRYTLHSMIISFVSFIIAALALHKLSYEIFANYLASKKKNNKKYSPYGPGTGSTTDGMKIPNRLADIAVLLFCFNPASVFYSIGYTESLFTACTFTGMYLSHKNRLVLSTLAFTAGAASRSNGILAIWFPLHRLLSHIHTTWWHCHQYYYYRHRQRNARPLSTKYSSWSFCQSQLVKTILACACICLPYSIIQIIAYSTYCSSSYIVDSDPDRAWCKTLVPSIYSHVQDKYWDVGFLRFYTKIDRWPNILQSVPVFGLCTIACWVYFSSNWERTFQLDLWTDDGDDSSSIHSSSSGGGSGSGTATDSDDDGGQDSSPRGVATSHIIPPLPSRRDPVSSSSTTTTKTIPRYVWQRYLINNDTPAPYFHYMALMTATAMLVMHVNVGTRFLSTCPPLYWYIATLMYPYYYYCNVSGRGKWVRRGVWVWCLSFTVAGCVLWPNFYPWT